MRIHGVRAAWVAVLGGLLAATAGRSLAGAPAETLFPTRHQSLASAAPEVRVPLEEMPPEVREKLRQVLDRPTLTVRGPAETFSCVPATYHWLLGHPDQGVQLWKRLGAQCVEIVDRGNGFFGWSDKLGSDLLWSTVHLTPRMRVIYASGQVKAGMLLPKVAVQAVVVVHYDEDGRVAERTTMTHQAEMALRTDSKAVSAAARLMGASAQRVGEQYMGQLQMFYSALAWYLDQHPDEMEGLLKGANGN
jgi:hypothetical protein